MMASEPNSRVAAGSSCCARSKSPDLSSAGIVVIRCGCWAGLDGGCARKERESAVDIVRRLLWPRRKSGNDVGGGVVKFLPQQISGRKRCVMVDGGLRTEERDRHQGKREDIFMICFLRHHIAAQLRCLSQWRSCSLETHQTQPFFPLSPCAFAAYITNYESNSIGVCEPRFCRLHSHVFHSFVNRHAVRGDGLESSEDLRVCKSAKAVLPHSYLGPLF
jgi:hypothetical protein